MIQNVQADEPTAKIGKWSVTLGATGRKCLSGNRLTQRSHEFFRSLMSTTGQSDCAIVSTL
jgi:hypothetical protein